MRYDGDFDLRLIRDDKWRPVMKNGRAQWAVLGEPRSVSDDGVEHYLERDSTTDLASMPRIGWTLLPPDGPWVVPAAFHDDGYRKRGEVARLNHPAPFTRKEIDLRFLEGMRAVGVVKWKREIIFRSVRLGGGAGWGS